MGKFKDTFVDPGGVFTGDSKMPLAANLGLGSSSNGKKATPQAPAPPDYKELIKEQARQNRVDSSTPYGGTTYEQTADGRWKSTTQFSPEVQKLLTQQLQLAGEGTGNHDYSQYGDMAMAMARRHLDPVFDRQHDRFEQTMANRGTPVGSEIYSDGYQNLSNAESKAYQDAAFNALQVGQGFRMQDDARTLQDYNMLASVLGNLQAQGTQPIDVMGPFGAQQSQIMNNYNQALNASNQASQNFWNTAGTVGAGAMMAFSDERLKINIERVGSIGDIGMYRWRWNEDARALGLTGEAEGPIAQEVAAKYPHCVVRDISGYLKINRSALAKQLEAA